MSAKCEAVRDIVPMHGPDLADTVAIWQLEVAALCEGVAHSGMLLARHHIASAGVFFFGGQS